MSEGYIVVSYDDDQRESYNLAAFSSEDRAEAWIAFLEAQSPGVRQKANLSIESIALDGEGWDAGGCWVAQVGADGRFWRSYFSAIGHHSDDPNNSEYRMPSYHGYGRTVEEAKARAAAARDYHEAHSKTLSFAALTPAPTEQP